MQTNQTNHPLTGGPDLFRIPAALLVVSIHTSPLASFGGEADFILTRIFARIAVPFFFMATGYFLLPSCLGERSGQSKALWIFIKKLSGLYLAATLLYFPVNIYAGHLQGRTPLSLLRMFLFEGTFYHLWYLPACILGTLLLFLGSRLLPFGALFAVTVLLYLLGLLGDSYYGFLPEGSVVKGIYDLMLELFYQTRGGLFYAPLFLAEGMGIRLLSKRSVKKADAHNEPSRSAHFHPDSPRPGPDMPSEGTVAKVKSELMGRRTLLWVGFLCCLAGMTAEGLALHRLNAQRHDSMYLTLPFCMFFLFSLLLTIRRPPSKHLRNLSTGIYLLHPLAILLVRVTGKAVHLEHLLIESSLIHFLAVCLTSWAAAIGICLLPTGLLCGCRPSSARRPGLPPPSAVCMPIRAAATAISTSFWEKSRLRQKAPQSRAWIELDTENLRHNLAELKSLLPTECSLMCVLKANAYGHGAVLLAGLLHRLGIRDFCVATLSEGIELRRNGIRGEILILGYTHPDQFPALSKYRLTQTVLDEAYARQLNACKGKRSVHLKIDTGMHRLGERAEKPEELYRIFQYDHLRITGTYTHLCAADSDSPADIAFCANQEKAFRQAILDLEERGCDCGRLHLLASHGLIRYPQWANDLARAGIALYGVLSNRRDLESCPVHLRPVLSLKARVAQVKEIRAGEGVGYGLQYVAKQDGMIAVLTIGYADGIPRSLSCGRGKVLIRQHEAPIVGRICMDQLFVDITGIPGVKAGDSAVLIGKDGKYEITAYDLAEGAETITNEILSRLSVRLERVLRTPNA